VGSKFQAKLAESNGFYVRKIARSGSSRYIAVSRILPKEWSVVRARVVKLEGDACILELKRLM